MMDLYEEGIHNLVVDNNQICFVSEMKSTGARVFKEAAMFGRDWEETFIRLVQERPALYNNTVTIEAENKYKKTIVERNFQYIWGKNINRRASKKMEVR